MENNLSGAVEDNAKVEETTESQRWNSTKLQF